jgi:hypothetical protein
MNRVSLSAAVAPRASRGLPAFGRAAEWPNVDRTEGEAMRYLQQLPFQSVVYPNCWLRLSKVSLRTIGYGVMVLGTMFWCLETAAAQQEGSDRQGRKEDLEIRKLGLEVDKLRLEVANLRKDRGELSSWLTGVVGLLTGIVGTATTVWVTRRTRLGALHQSVHDKRLESYPQLMKASARLAAYFPSGYSARISIGTEDCRRMGQAMSEWYFGGGGLLLSIKARDAYFRLVRAFTRASQAADLKVPTFPQDAENISVEKLVQYRKELEGHNDLDDVEAWRFGEPVSEQEKLAQRFRDFVFLQRLSSILRTKLSEDIRSRRRPS